MSPRIVTGILMAVAVILLVLYLPPVLLKLVIAAVVALAVYELARMILPPHPTSSRGFAVVLGTALSLVVMFAPGNTDPSQCFSTLLLALPAILMLSFIFYLWRPRSLELVLNQVAYTFLATVYAGLMLSFLGLIRDLPHGSSWVFLVLASTFGADTGAYITGRLLGRHKLAPHISPGKTVEGLLGGILLSILWAFGCKYLISKDILLKDCWWVGLSVGLVGPLGDLSESLLKRSVGVKDSGHLIPGHGGVLDRIDALLFTSPIVYYYAAYIRS